MLYVHAYIIKLLCDEYTTLLIANRTYGKNDQYVNKHL